MQAQAQISAAPVSSGVDQSTNQSQTHRRLDVVMEHFQQNGSQCGERWVQQEDQFEGAQAQGR